MTQTPAQHVPPTAVQHAITVAVPPRWRRRTDPANGVIVSARAPNLPVSGVRPDLTLRCAPVGDDDLVAWRASAIDDLAGLLVDFALEDEDEYDLLGHDVAYRRFAHRVGTVDVLCDQWAWLIDGQGVTLSCSAAREDYPDYCDLFDTIAESVEVRP